MPKVKVYDMSNNEVGTMTLKDEVFGAEYNEALIHQVVVAQNANARQGTKSTLTRSEVRGHAKKPWNQKHTGHARQGSTKGPHYVGGGVVFAPKPRDFSKKVNIVARRVALVSALSQKLAQKELTVLNECKLNEVKTKEMQNFLNSFKFEKSVLLVLPEKDADVLRASNNIKNLTVTTSNLINVYEVVRNRNVVFTKQAIKALEEAYA